MTYDELYAIAPSILLGLFCGIASYFSGFNDDINHKPSIRKALGSGMSSAILSFIAFALLDATNLTFMQKLGISCCVAFLGLDKALDYVERIMALRRGGKNE